MKLVLVPQREQASHTSKMTGGVRVIPRHSLVTRIWWARTFAFGSRFPVTSEGQNIRALFRCSVLNMARPRLALCARSEVTAVTKAGDLQHCFTFLHDVTNI